MERFALVFSRYLLRIAVDEIVYVKADANYSDLVLINGVKYKIPTQLAYFEINLRTMKHAHWFIRVGRSLIVNYQHIQIINLNNKTITFGGKHLVNKPRTTNPHALLQENGIIDGDLYTVTASFEALSLLKEKVESILETERT